MRTIIKKMLLCMCTLVTFVVMGNVCYGASIGLSVGYRSITVGGKTTLTITGNDAIGRISITSSNSNIVSVSSTSAWLEGSTSVTLTTKSVGSATITVSAVDMATGSGAAFTGSNSVTIQVNPVYIDTRSKNCNLGSLSITGFELNTPFDTNTNEYSVKVPHEVETIDVVAKAQDGAAKVAITGNTELKYGENITTVTVTAENGAQKSYTIKVNRDKNPDDINPYLKSLQVMNTSFRNETGKEVYLNVCEDISVDVNKLDIIAIPEIEGAKVEIIGNEDLKVGINKIEIEVTSKDKSASKTYEIIVVKSEEMLNLQEVEPDKTVKDYIQEYWLQGVLGIVVLIELIIIIVLLVTKKSNTYVDRTPRKKDKVEEEKIENTYFEELEKSNLEKDAELTEDVLKYNNPNQNNTRRHRRG